MKNILVILMFLVVSGATSQEVDKVRQSLDFQQELDSSYMDPETTPLTPEDFKNFKGLEFFPVDTAFHVVAEFVRSPLETPFQMPTTTDRKPYYVKYGEVYFSLKGKEYKLDLFQNLELKTNPEYKDYLFAPFTDMTNGETTYGGGRYLDVRIPKENTMILDFNKAYNPYCAYNGKYSCPIPPEENHLELKVTAGVKKFH